MFQLHVFGVCPNPGLSGQVPRLLELLSLLDEMKYI